MKIPIIATDGSVLKEVEHTEVDDVGAIFIGSGLARRTFVLSHDSPTRRPTSSNLIFSEVKTCQMEDPAAVSAVEKMSAAEARALDEADKQMATVMLPPGVRLCVALVDTDGEFIISYDHKGDRKLSVHASMPGSVLGDEGTIYLEDFGPDVDVTEKPSKEALDEAEAWEHFDNVQKANKAPLAMGGAGGYIPRGK